MTIKVVVVAVVVAVALARPELVQEYVAPARPAPSYNVPAYPKVSNSAAAYPDSPAQYNSQFTVKDDSGNDFGHQESRDGYDTKGTYYVQLPDGRVQKVNYVVSGDSGFVPQVSYEGEAQYPAYQPTQAYKTTPAYQPSPAKKPAKTYNPELTYA
ncbi:pro-resilin-like [Cherax quadricarinatus]|uniref:pro-resilin-like n=1 Tax=Cherax quadricarinatus TaxID=27406 RepID=UPI00387E4EF1